MPYKLVSLVIILSLMWLTTGCNKRPEGVLSEKKMVDILTDLQMAQAYYSTSSRGPGAASRDALTESVLTKHGVTQEEMDSTISYYGRNIDEYYKLYSKVEKNLRSRTGKSEVPVNENDIWPYERFTALLPNQATDGLIFSIPADEINPGEGIEWRMRLTSSNGIETTMGVEYANGETSIVKKNGGGDNTFKVNLLTDTAQRATRIFGIMTASQGVLPIWVDSIRLIKTEFDSTEYYRYRAQKKIGKPSKKVKTEVKEPIDSLR